MVQPKVSKLKTKTELPEAVVKKEKRPKKVANFISADNQHLVFQFADYVLSHMDGIESEYYKKASRKKERPVKYLIAKALLDFFRIQDPQVNLTTLLEKETKK